MVTNKFVEFHKMSQDFLSLLGDKLRLSERNKAASEEVAVLEFFWNSCEALIREYELELMEAKLLAVNSQVKARLLDCDMRDLLNEIYKVRNKLGADEIARIMARKALPSRGELMQDVQVKNQKI